MSRTSKMLASAVLALGLFNGAAVQAAEPVALNRFEQRLPAAATVADLRALTAACGYQPEAFEYGDREGFGIRTTRGGVEVVVHVFLSPDRKHVMIGSRLAGTVDPANPAHAAGLVRLLERNDDVAPCFFAYQGSTKQRWLLLMTPAANLTPAHFFESIERVIRTVAETFPAWDMAKWTAPAPAVTATTTPTTPAPTYEPTPWRWRTTTPSWRQ
jgi:hypothetical protein